MCVSAAVCIYAIERVVLLRIAFQIVDLDIPCAHSALQKLHQTICVLELSTCLLFIRNKLKTPTPKYDKLPHPPPLFPRLLHWQLPILASGATWGQKTKKVSELNTADKMLEALELYEPLPYPGPCSQWLMLLLLLLWLFYLTISGPKHEPHVKLDVSIKSQQWKVSSHGTASL